MANREKYSSTLYQGEKYSYYNYKYSMKDDLSRLPKKWGKTLGVQLD